MAPRTRASMQKPDSVDGEEANDASSRVEQVQLAPTDSTPTADDAVEGEVKLPPGKSSNPVQQARATKSEVIKKQREIERLERQRDELAKRVKENRDALRRAEQELVDLESAAKRASRGAAKVNREKLGERFTLKASQAKRSSTAAFASLKSARARVDTTKSAIESARSKEEDAKRSRSRALQKVVDAEARCQELRAAGEEVPDVYDESQDLVAHGAWKPPGVVAAKARVAARAALAKVEQVVEKARADVVAKEIKHQNAEKKVGTAKEKRSAADQKKITVDGALAKLLPMKVQGKANTKGKKPPAKVVKGSLKAKARIKARPSRK